MLYECKWTSWLFTSFSRLMLVSECKNIQFLKISQKLLVFLPQDPYKYSLFGKYTHHSKTKTINNCLVDMYFVCYYIVKRWRQKSIDLAELMLNCCKTNATIEVVVPGLSVWKIIMKTAKRSTIHRIQIKCLWGVETFHFNKFSFFNVIVVTSSKYDRCNKEVLKFKLSKIKS